MSQPLSTPSTAHLSFSTIYEPSEDSFLLLDTLSAPTEQNFFRTRFPSREAASHISRTSTTPNRPLSATPLILEVGTGSGVVIAFLTAHAEVIFGQRVLALGVDVNNDACLGTRQTVELATLGGSSNNTNVASSSGGRKSGGTYLASVNGDLTSCLRESPVDVLVFNPPYVPTETLPDLPKPPPPPSLMTGSSAPDHNQTEPSTPQQLQQRRAAAAQARHERESHLLALSYAGGHDGMETTERLLRQIPTVLSQRGVAYVLLCARNRPDEVRERILGWQCGDDADGWDWRAEFVGESGGKGGWERLVVLRIWRERAR